MTVYTGEFKGGTVGRPSPLYWPQDSTMEGIRMVGPGAKPR